MEAILAFVQELLTHLKEFDAAAIIEIIKNFFGLGVPGGPIKS